MTTFTTNTRPNMHTDLNARGHQLIAAQVSRLTAMISATFSRKALSPQNEIAKAERREAARRAVDALLR